MPNYATKGVAIRHERPYSDLRPAAVSEPEPDASEPEAAAAPGAAAPEVSEEAAEPGPPSAQDSKAAAAVEPDADANATTLRELMAELSSIDADRLAEELSFRGFQPPADKDQMVSGRGSSRPCSCVFE